MKEEENPTFQVSKTFISDMFLNVLKVAQFAEDIEEEEKQDKTLTMIEAGIFVLYTICKEEMIKNKDFEMTDFERNLLKDAHADKEIEKRSKSNGL